MMTVGTHADTPWTGPRRAGGAVRLLDCAAPPGFFAAGGASPAACPAGNYCVGAQEAPAACPANTDSPGRKTQITYSRACTKMFTFSRVATDTITSSFFPNPPSDTRLIH